MACTRRKFMKSTAQATFAGTASAGFFLSGCNKKDSSNKVKLGVSGFSADAYRKLIDELGFTDKTGIEVEVVLRPKTTNELLMQMASSIQAGTSPYDILDFEDSIAMSLSRAGWLAPLDDLISQDVWDDFTPALMKMTKDWDQYKGQTFRIHHNFELCYWWYRKDWFDSKGIAVPKTWDDVSAMGKVFTDKAAGIWASEEGLIKNCNLSVYLEWITRQAGGNPYQAGPELQAALRYIHDLMFKHDVMNPSCIQKNYDQQNNDYIADRVAFMRQWPFFYDVTRQHKKWFNEDKVVCGLPPVGPAGAASSTYACGWGWGIPKTAPRYDQACELLKFLISVENSPKLLKYSNWFLNARHSVLNAAGEDGLVKYLKMYLDAGIVTTRPFHSRRYTEAVSKIENIASAYLTNQITLADAMKSTRKKMDLL
ncbi:MAG: extracellular solute-binding protein [Phycisphaerae bacterium]|nr:extracellular solute-binding protein [Phycisphaerae bacterium]